jgi:hypothetical protein
MRSCPLNAVVRSLHSPLFSPAGLLLRGASLAVLFVMARMLGLQDYASVVSGTPGSSVPLVAQTLGVVYLFLHIGFYFVAPVLCLAAWIMAGLMRIAPGR